MVLNIALAFVPDANGYSIFAYLRNIPATMQLSSTNLVARSPNGIWGTDMLDMSTPCAAKYVPNLNTKGI